MTVVIDPAFDPVPSLARSVDIAPAATVDEAVAQRGAQAVPVWVPVDGDIAVEVDRDLLAAAGFRGKTGQTLRLPGSPLRVLVGIGDGAKTHDTIRDAVAAFARASAESPSLALDLATLIAAGADAAQAAQAAVEGAVLARYSYDQLKTDAKTVALESLTLVVADADRAAVEAGAARGTALARAATIARDLSNTPPRHLTAEKFAEVAVRLAPQFGLEVEIFDRDALVALGTGGLLGVNAGSVDEPRMIKVRYTPANAGAETPSLALIGKGIMFDSGGISLKPSSAMHGMKFDMMGAANVFGSMTALRDLGAETAVTGWLMCTDNMLSGSATKIGDVLTIRGGTTVEVKNSDAEGRLVMADGLVLATEEERRPDAILDIATLTGNAMAALGLSTAAIFANNDAVAAQLQSAADATDERVWRLPLDHRYRDQLKSNVADLSNIGGQYAGAILAALFLNEFVDGLPWGHIDIAPTMESERDDLWRSVGGTAFGARLLAEFAVAFERPETAE